jgi:hypothetical protein
MRASTATVLRQQPSLLGRNIEVTLPESLDLERWKIRASTKADDCISQALTVPLIPMERERKASTAATGIVAPPPQLVQVNCKPTESKKKTRKKVSNYPPERQYPPAPAYPARDTPAWTKPDTYTPPPKPKAEPAPRKSGFFWLGAKLKAEPRYLAQRHRSQLISNSKIINPGSKWKTNLGAESERGSTRHMNSNLLRCGKTSVRHKTRLPGSRCWSSTNTDPAKDEGSGKGASEQPKRQQQRPGKAGAKAVQNSSSLSRHWCWGWRR